jgi:riboflavin synthase
MAGHVITLYRGASKKPVDYNDRERPYRVKQEFSPNHRHDPFLFPTKNRTNHKTNNMFSGIIEEFATVVAIKKDRENIDFTLTCSFTDELKIDQSVAHNGVCLTVVSIDGNNYTVTAMKETLDRSNLGQLSVDDKVNIERSMMMNGRLDGHIVQGHVDMTARCIDMKDADGSTYFTFEYDYDPEMARHGYFTVDKGSVTVNGVSLTVCRPTKNTFQVAIIPYTMEHTNFQDIRVGTLVNLEFDILGKYIARLSQLQE